MSDTVQQIKERLDVADFIRGYVQLSPAGKNLKGLCPFHKEKTPSFIVSPDRQIWHCFGCNTGGDIVGFLMRYENLEFFEALKILGEKAGIDVGRTGNQDQKQLSALYEANRVAKDFFKSNLSGNSLEYLKSRGLKSETIAEFELGFAPDQPDALARQLFNAGYNVAILEKSGLILKTDRGTYRDRFRNRIMFPIANQFGKIVAFTGRIMPGHESENIGKYVNSPETQIFNKSKILFGLDKSKGAIRDSRSAVLVEGQMDFLMSWQDGVKNLVAASGTALTGEHLKHLKKIADTLLLSFDQDAAGVSATERAIDLAAASDLSVKVVRLPAEFQAKDPADIVQSHPGIFGTFLEKAQPAMNYYLDKYQVSSIKYKELSIHDQKKNLRAVLAKIKNIYSPVERSQWLKQVSDYSGIAEAVLAEEMEDVKASTVPADQNSNLQPREELQFSRPELISQKIISVAINHKEFAPEILARQDILPPNYQKISAHYCDIQSLSLPAELQPLADLVHLRSGLEIILEKDKAKKELEELFRQLRLEKVNENLKEKHRLIEAYEKEGRDVMGLLEEKMKLIEERRRLEIKELKAV